MRNLIIYEKFTSSVVSRTIAYLHSINVTQVNKFIQEFNNVCKMNDINQHLIQDDDLQYLNAKKAIDIKAPDMWSADIYAYKFWFSINDGYMGVTSIGSKFYNNEEVQFPALIEEDMIRLASIIGDTGTIRQVKYEDLKHGDQVVISLSSEFMNMYSSETTIATIYDSYGTRYAIQNKKQGNEPSDRLWKELGRYSWQLGRANPRPGYNDLGSDWGIWGKYMPSDSNLVYIADSTTKDIFSFNLPVNSEYKQIRWSETNLNGDIIKESNFCVILYVARAKSNDKYKVSNLKRERDLRKAKITIDNYDRYFTQISKQLNNLENLTKIVKMSISYIYPLETLAMTSSQFIEYLTTRVGKIHIDAVKQMIISQYNNTQAIKKYVKQVSNIYDPRIIKIVNQINDYITMKVNSIEIETTLDLRFMLHKFTNIISILGDSMMTKSIYIKNCQTYHFPTDDEIEKMDVEQEIENLTKLKKYIEKTL